MTVRFSNSEYSYLETTNLCQDWKAIYDLKNKKKKSSDDRITEFSRKTKFTYYITNIILDRYSGGRQH